MYNELKELLNNSKSPYYNLRVSAILVCNDSTKFSGVNVETSSPSSGICAERNALYSAITAGYNKEDFKEMHIMLDNKSGGTPCFICRQALSDFLNELTPLYLYSNDGPTKTVILKDLIPFPFSKEDLK